ncbi:hypothetical protein C3489_09015 [Streptomyces sp. Ru71]|uniref:DUF4232 domain-containing protein n=1 Tax=Streptomyces sp. Ru71 TaxID=2080746 RepID=UPI000CDD4F47|nr:DUF4232 domain-containing protein [Streptomyces sp. Ru71]POX55719.1 hypothetical protein C3489_09015 [Streptomyces sp. Ru71]
MRATPITVAALAAALLLTACDSSNDTAGGTDNANAASGTTATGTACRLGTVGAQVGPVSEAPAAGDTGTVTVTLTNQGTDCTLEGFPQVTLQAGEKKATVPADQAAQSQKLTLAKDATASFTITYTRAAESSGAQSLAAKTATFTLPGGRETQDFPWSYGEVALKDSAPDATVSGFQQSGD